MQQRVLALSIPHTMAYEVSEPEFTLTSGCLGDVAFVDLNKWLQWISIFDTFSKTYSIYVHSTDTEWGLIEIVYKNVLKIHYIQT